LLAGSFLEFSAAKKVNAEISTGPSLVLARVMKIFLILLEMHPVVQYNFHPSTCRFGGHAASGESGRCDDQNLFFFLCRSVSPYPETTICSAAAPCRSVIRRYHE